MSAGVDLDDRGLAYVTWGSEYDLRDGVAEVARMFGWVASTEVPLSGWGRVDVVASAATTTLAIELKRSLRTPGEVRSAFMQAATYRRAHLNGATVILSAATFDDDVVSLYRGHFPGVTAMSAGDLLLVLQHDKGTLTYRTAEMQRRLDAAVARVESLRCSVATLRALAGAA